MNDIRVSGSFRDPKGHVFIKNGRVFRTITSSGAADFQAVRDSGLLDALVDEGSLVSWKEVSGINLGGPEKDSVSILEHDCLDFVSYPYEWSFSGLKAAALLHLDIQIKALAKGIALSDASAYNIQFVGSHPVFIDHLSFRPYRDGEFWAGHHQFVCMFLNPLLLRSSLGIQHNAWYRGEVEGIPTSSLSAILPWYAWLNPSTLMHVKLPAYFDRRVIRRKNTGKEKKAIKGGLPRHSFKNMLNSIKSAVEGLNPKGANNTVWSGYNATTSYTPEEAEIKKAFIRSFANCVRPKMLWDIGCNTGEFSKIALESGAEHVVGFEFDAGALELAFARSRNDNLAMLPLFLDVANPSPSQGWRQKERYGISERRCANAIISLAVIHHICIGKNVPVREAVSWLVGLAPHGVIEFVPKQDPMVQELLCLREDIFTDYTIDVFEDAIVGLARIVKSETITESGRKLVWYERGV